MQATAAVLYEVKKPVVVEDVEVLEPGSHEVRVRWVANGVCHSDLHVITGDYPHPLPVVLGHEAAGVVEKVGPDVETVQVGDHVCSSYIPSCGRCSYCIGGQPTMCALRDKPRWFMLDGTSRIRSSNGVPLHVFLQVAGYATHTVLPEPSVIPIRADAPLDVVCLVSCGVLAGAGPVFNRAKVPPGASVAVWGCGGVGLNTIQAAKMLGAGKIIAVDVMKQKLQWAEEFGATHVVDASKSDPVAEVQRISGTSGVKCPVPRVDENRTRIGYRWPISCTAQPLPSGSLKKTKRPHGKSCTSPTSMPRPTSSARAASASGTTSWRPSSEPGAMPVGGPMEIEQPDPGGVSCTKRTSSLTVWSWSGLNPNWST